ncbi:MAG TPA: 30S ribosomal protein S20 [Candidatus Atribacteria bacterium]|nr:30S ribosomal protein S20 [Candidatus Atribacteria bacterium]HPT78877.1 30S ribosomal protein S20 [Candidatus Atribacteria bacterium]
MPNTKSAMKRVKVIKAKTLRNKMIKSSLKTISKKFENALSENNLDLAKSIYPKLVKKIDMAAAKGTIHKNAANRKKAKLALRLKAAELK